METAFARWLGERDETPHRYARRKGMNTDRVMLLAGVSRSPRTVTRWHMPSLTTISEETGIPIAELIADATRAAANPRPPRQYNRKAEGERADA